MALVVLWNSEKHEQFNWHQYLLGATKAGKCKESYFQNGNELVFLSNEDNS